MACLTLKCLETIGLGLRGDVTVRLNNQVSSLFSSTFHPGSLVTFTNGNLYSLQLLTTRCGFNQTPNNGRPFNGCGTFSWTAQRKQIGAPTQSVSTGATWAQRRFSKGLYTVWATWTPNACASQVKVTWLNRTYKGVDATKSYPVNLTIV